MVDLYAETNTSQSCDAVAIARDTTGGMGVLRACPAGGHGDAGESLARGLAVSLLPSLSSLAAPSGLGPTPGAREVTVHLGRATRRRLADVLDTSAAALIVAVPPAWVPRIRPMMAGAYQLEGTEIDAGSPATLGNRTQVT
ncbi:MAG: hypothetical protein WCA29_03775 [Jiangellales bacterium]